MVKEGFSAYAIRLLADAGADVPLARKALRMSLQKYPEDPHFAELQALYIIGVLDYPPD